MRRKSIFTAVAVVIAALITVLALGLQTAQGMPSYQQDCSNCHGTRGSYPNGVSASPNPNTVAPGATYQVNISMSPAVNGSTGTGYWIANSDASGSTGSSTGVYDGGAGANPGGSWTATMTAPATPGTYYYKVFGQSGPVGSNGLTGYALYSITVADQTTSTPTATQVPPTSTSTQVPPTATAVVTNTSVPPTSTPVPPTSTSVPPTSTQVTTIAQGSALYGQYCASCHDPSSPSYVRKNISGKSRQDIIEALNKKSMSSLKSVLSTSDINNIALYLRSLKPGNDKNRDVEVAIAKDNEADMDKAEDTDQDEEQDTVKPQAGGIEKNKHKEKD